MSAELEIIHKAKHLAKTALKGLSAEEKKKLFGVLEKASKLSPLMAKKEAFKGFLSIKPIGDVTAFSKIAFLIARSKSKKEKILLEVRKVFGV